MDVILSTLFMCLVNLYLAHGEHLAINWTEADIVGSSTESHMENPAVKPLSPCPCDLTSHFCDPHCCCDKDCSSFDTTTFSCLEGLDGGQATDKTVDNNCKYQGPYSPEWHNFLCFLTENNPYLGLFYKPEPSVQIYFLRVQRPVYSYEDTIPHNQDQEYHPYYILGSSVETLIMANDTIAEGVLSLPQQVLNGICIKTIPIYFLEDFSHECPLPLSPEICKTEPLLSTASYLQNAEKIIRDPFKGFPQVISNLTTLQTVNASVEYKCLQDTKQFIKVQGVNKVVPKLPNHFWGTDKENTAVECDGINIPFYNDVSQMCENVVLSVEYNIGWRGPSISEVHAKIKVGNVAVSLDGLYGNYLSDFDRKLLQDKHVFSKPEYASYKTMKFVPSASSKLSLLQHFVINFHHVKPSDISNSTSELMVSLDNQDADVVEDLEYSPNISERSGNPGYKLGKPIISGYIMHSVTSDDNNTIINNSVLVVINNTTGLYIWRPDKNGECKESLIEVITFGVDMISACLYSWRDIYSCDDLREKILSLFYSLIRSDVVSKLGWPNITEESDFLPTILDTPENMNLLNSADCQVPFSMSYEILYQDIIDVTRNNFPVYQVIGTYVRFNYREIQFSSSFSGGSVSLTTSVTFMNHRVPSTLSRFWEGMQDRWCAGGTCWREILQPWTHPNTESDVPTTKDYYSTYIMNLIVNSALMLLVFIPLVVLTLQHSYQLNI
ncbi:tectonic-2-like isoform X2 [Homarus americanus]|uniref:tectonic-2-like isoform X2 n=1 Tax=Homarus americanus TaxID=6706 RepID=UPI001C47E2B3|nr:tectonic-2-like isoform X2 [Homarus americanus]